MTKIFKLQLVMVLMLVFAAAAIAEGPYGDPIHTKRGVMDGNQVVTEFFNYGMIANWPDQPAGVWPKGTNHSYVDGVALIVSASTVDIHGNRIHPMSTQYREFMDSDPITGENIGWAALPGYANPNQNEPAMSDNPSSWPLTWPGRPHAWDGFWNGYFGKGVLNADLETLFAMDDAIDNEYDFYPDSTDSLRRGLGLSVEVRGFQWNHVLAEDCIFWHYAIENVGTTEYDSTVFGMYIDWGVGGTDDSGDDAGSYDVFLDLAYAWDGNGFGTPGSWGPVGYAGFAFLESPGNFTDGIDNDDDDLIDESRVDGIDNDGDWDAYRDINENGEWDEDEPLMDDLGADGVGPADLSYRGPDEGQGDGIPTLGEPDFDVTDKDESDQIGLTAFTIFPVHFYELMNEEQNWSVMSRLIPPTDEQLLGVNLGMYFFSGVFPLDPGQTERFSMALLFGNDQDDLFRNKETVQAIYNANYNFAQPPYKPTLTAIPGDKRVILMWDDFAEQSYDRFLREFDFEGYRIYRSTDPSFIDARLVTDAYGNPTYRKPLVQFDLEDGRIGPHLVGVYGAHFDMGTDTGIPPSRTYIDTTVMNGVTYYYSVVSYDFGFVQGKTFIDTVETSDEGDSIVVRFSPDFDENGQIIGIAPTECTSTIIGEVGGEANLDINCAMVTPNAPAAGYVKPDFEDGVLHLEGAGTGDVTVNLLVNDSLKDGHSYEIRFENAENHGDFLRFTKSMSLFDLTENRLVYQSDSLAFGGFEQFGEGDPVFWLRDSTASRLGKYFTLEPNIAHPLFWHQNYEFVETPIVDGLSVKIHNPIIHYEDDVDLGIDSVYGAVVTNANYQGEVDFHQQLSLVALKVPYAFEIRWTDELVDESKSILGGAVFDADSVNFTVWNKTLDERSDFGYTEYWEEWIRAPGDTVRWVDEFWIVPIMPYEAQDAVSVGIRLTAPPFIVDTTITGIDSTFDSTFVAPINFSEGDYVGWIPPVPFSSDDVFQFTVNQGHLDAGKEKADLDRIAVVPNPYVATSSWEPRSTYSTGRGERKIDFINLPRKCSIRIYTMSGFHVKTLEHNESFQDGAESWNLVSKDGMDIAYGVYIFHVDAPGVGEKIGKFAVIK